MRSFILSVTIPYLVRRFVFLWRDFAPVVAVLPLHGKSLYQRQWFSLYMISGRDRTDVVVLLVYKSFYLQLRTSSCFSLFENAIAYHSRRFYFFCCGYFRLFVLLFRPLGSFWYERGKSVAL